MSFSRRPIRRDVTQNLSDLYHARMKSGASQRSGTQHVPVTPRCKECRRRETGIRPRSPRCSPLSSSRWPRGFCIGESSEKVPTRSAEGRTGAWPWRLWFCVELAVGQSLSVRARDCLARRTSGLPPLCDCSGQVFTRSDDGARRCHRSALGEKEERRYYGKCKAHASSAGVGIA